MSTFSAPSSPTSGLAGYDLEGASPRPPGTGRTLYVSRPLINSVEVAVWAEEQGFGSILVDMHATVAFSKMPVDWSLFEPDPAGLIVAAGERSLAVFDDSAVVLCFESPILAARWREFLDAGASWDHDSYRPHVTITYAAGAIDVAAVEAFPGSLEFGPEVFAEVGEDPQSTVREVAAKLAKEKRDMPGKLNLFIPFSKVDSAQRLVYGLATAEKPDRAGEICDYDTTKPHYEVWSGDVQKASGGKSYGNLRSMHSNIAAGKLTQLAFNDDEKQIEICAKVVDEAEWQKVEDGVYTGFSQGGEFIKRWKDSATGLMRYTARPIEISLVDVPCLPNATFELIKAAGGAAERKPFANVLEPEPAAPGNDAVVAKAKELAKTAGVEDKWTNFIERGREELLKLAGAGPRPFHDPRLAWLAAPLNKIVRSKADVDLFGRAMLATIGAPDDEPVIVAVRKLVGPADFDAIAHEEELRKWVGERVGQVPPAATNAEDLGVQQVWKAKDGSTHLTKRAALDHTARADADAAASLATKGIEDRLGQISAALDKRALTLSGLQEALAKRDDAFRVGAGVSVDDWKVLNDFVRERAEDPLVKGVGLFPPMTVSAAGEVSVSPELKAAIGEFLGKVRTAPAPKGVDERADLRKAIDEADAGKTHGARRKATKAAKKAKATDILPAAWAGSTAPDRLAKMVAPQEVRKAASLYGLANMLQLLSAIEMCEEELESPSYYGSSPTVAKSVTDRFGALVVELGDICAEVLDVIVGSMRTEEAGEAMTLVAAAGELVKAGARHSRGDRTLLKTAHDAIVGLGHDCAPAAKGAEPETMAKAASERDALLAKIGDLAPRLDEILKRVANIEAQPSPRNALAFRSFEKGGDGGGTQDPTAGEVLGLLTDDQRATIMIKLAQRQPVHMSLPR